jgi:HK97 family phage major capsid protein
MEILTDVVEWSPVRPLCRVRTTGRSGVEIPRRLTPAAASWVSETGTRSETTNPTFTMETIPTHELYAMVQVSAQEMEDSLFDLQAFLREEFAEQFGVTEGAAIVDGNGVGRPEGFMQHAGIGYKVSGHASEITADGLLDAYHELKEAYLANATWVMSRSTLRDIRKLKDATGNYLWSPGIKLEARPAQLLDRPYVTAPDMPTIAANAYPVAIGDFRRGYLLLDRLELSMMVDPYTAKRTGMIEISARKRVGGQVIIADAIKKLKIAAA